MFAHTRSSRAVGSRRKPMSRGNGAAESNVTCSNAAESEAGLQNQFAHVKEYEVQSSCFTNGSLMDENFETLSMDEASHSIEQLENELSMEGGSEYFEPIRRIANETYPWPAPKIFSGP